MNPHGCQRAGGFGPNPGTPRLAVLVIHLAKCGRRPARRERSRRIKSLPRHAALGFFDEIDQMRDLRIVASVGGFQRAE